jgi:haloalkane dehalogenase
MNTGLGIGKLPSQAWAAFRDFIKRSPDVDVGALISRGTPLRPEEIDAYRAPYEGAEGKAGVRRFPVSTSRAM